MRSSGTPFMKLGFVSRAAMGIHDTLRFKVCKAGSYPWGLGRRPYGHTQRAALAGSRAQSKESVRAYVISF